MAKDGWGVYAVDTIGESLDGTAGARACTVPGVIKKNSLGAPYVVANEFISGRLALALGLPVPPGEIVQLNDGGLGYVSLRFGPTRRVAAANFPRRVRCGSPRASSSNRQLRLLDLQHRSP